MLLNGGLLDFGLDGVYLKAKNGKLNVYNVLFDLSKISVVASIGDITLSKKTTVYLGEGIEDLLLDTLDGSDLEIYSLGCLVLIKNRKTLYKIDLQLLDTVIYDMLVLHFKSVLGIDLTECNNFVHLCETQILNKKYQYNGKVLKGLFPSENED